MEVYERIKYLRKDVLHLTQEQFAPKARISRSNLGAIEIGRVGVTDRVLDDICDSYNVNKEWLENGIGGDDNIFKKISPSAKAYSRFRYLIENGSPQKKATLTTLLELMYVVPDKQWELIMKTYLNALKEAEEEAEKG